MFLPGLVGCGALWLRACRQVEAVYDAGRMARAGGRAAASASWPCSGRCTSAATRPAVPRAGRRRRRRPATGWPGPRRAARRRAARWSSGTSTGSAPCRLHALCRARCRRPGRRQAARAVGGGHAQPSAPGSDLARLLRFFPGTVELPPLRHHIEDLHELVPFFLARLSQHGRLACSPEAMQLLLRSNWPGNTEQLWQVLKRVVQHRRTGTIHAGATCRRSAGR